MGEPDVVFYEFEEYKVYTAGEIRELISPERTIENKEIPPEVFIRLAGIPENRRELATGPEELTEEQVYNACRVHLKGIHRKKKLVRVIRCSYLLDFEPPS
ncbi:MAG: hypothetical protein LIP05_03505 [Tannerellaceae bacterium]|nr:hypothetical protein [Tannerellaceae bacterium]